MKDAGPDTLPPQASPLGPTDGPRARRLRSPGELEEVRRLVHDVYLDEGYIDPQPDGRLVYAERLDTVPETAVFVVEAAGSIIGTSSLSLDGPAGFHFDGEYPAEARRLRREGRRLASSWRLAIRGRGPERTRALLELVRANRDLASAWGVQTCLFTLVPRYAPVYRRLFGAVPLAAGDPGRGCSSPAPSMFRCPTVLMRWDVERCPARWSAGSGIPRA